MSVHALFFKLTGKLPDISHHSIFSYLDNIISARSFVCSCLRVRWCQDSFPHWQWTHRTLMGDCDCWWGQAFKEPGYLCMATLVWTHICDLALKGKSPEQWCLGNNKHTQHTDWFLFGLIDWLIGWLIDWSIYGTKNWTKGLKYAGLMVYYQTICIATFSLFILR